MMELHSANEGSAVGAKHGESLAASGRAGSAHSLAHKAGPHTYQHHPLSISPSTTPTRPAPTIYPSSASSLNRYHVRLYRVGLTRPTAPCAFLPWLKLSSPYRSLISLISKSDVRYQGVLHEINSENSTVSLSNVQSFGTEGRRNGVDEMDPSEDIWPYIVFRGSDVKDLQIVEPPKPKTQQPPASMPNDPAILGVSEF